MKAQIEITNHCNLKCSGCLREDMNREITHMSTAVFSKTIMLCRDLGVTKVILHHLGEPLLHPYLCEYIIMCKLMGFEVSFTTNGTLLTVEKLYELKRAGLDELDISYNTSKRINETMNVINDKLKYLYHRSQKMGIRTYFRSVVFSRSDFNYLKRTFNHVRYLVKFQKGMYNDKSKKNNKKKCKAIEKLFVVQSDGNVVPCCAMINHRQYTYGDIVNLTPHKLLNEIFILRHKIRKGEVDYCTHCFEVDKKIPIDSKL